MARPADAPKGGASEEAPDGDKLITPSIVLEQTALVPGQTAYLGVHFKIAPEWHIYWRNNGDSGMPPNMEWKPTTGIELGECQWPTPMRHVQPGDILDYIFEHEVTLIYPVKVSESLKAGDTVTLTLILDWLVCKDMCLPGSRELSVTYPVAANSQSSSDAPLFAKARARLPHAASELGLQMTTSWSERTLLLRVDGAEELTFFPQESDDGVYPFDMLGSGWKKEDHLTLEYDASLDAVERVKGVLEVKKGGKTSFVEVDLPAPKKPG